MTTYTLNAEKNGVEITFGEKPSTEIRNRLKELGFRWHGLNKLWYAKQTDERIQFAITLANTTETEPTTEDKPKEETPVDFSDWSGEHSASYMRDCEVFEINARVTEDGLPEAMAIDAYIKVPTKEVSVDITATYRYGMVIEVPIYANEHEYVRDYVHNLMDDAPCYISVSHDGSYVDFELEDYDHDIW